jgi:hypothetical protein
MAIAPMELGRAVRRWTHSDASFTVIEQTEAREGGWGDGGCWILADALASGFGLEMFGVFGHHVPGIDPTPRLQHVCGQSWEWFHRSRRLPDGSHVQA